MPLSFPNPDGKVPSRAGRPRPACSVFHAAEQADEDVGRGPGGPPHQDRSVRAKLNPFYAKVESYRLRDVP